MPTWSSTRRHASSRPSVSVPGTSARASDILSASSGVTSRSGPTVPARTSSTSGLPPAVEMRTRARGNGPPVNAAVLPPFSNTTDSPNETSAPTAPLSPSPAKRGPYHALTNTEASPSSPTWKKNRWSAFGAAPTISSGLAPHVTTLPSAITTHLPALSRRRPSLAASYALRFAAR